ncbi:MAG TPA: YlxM family DNA-binding protein [Anaerovoracaceae bacterium]|nr:YlxM family DNA-binding protein [Anaerovoracaceae bacterium]
MFEKMIEISMLYDFYGPLLTAKQRELLKLHHEDNYSLSEIAEEYGISRQGVHDAVKKAEKALHEYESKLGLISRFNATEKAVKNADSEIDRLIRENSQNRTLSDRLRHIKAIIDKINE